MKALTLITQNFKNIMIGVLIVFVIIALMKCNGEKNRNQALELAGKALEQKVATAEAERLEGRKQFDDYKKDAEGKHILVAIEKQEADNRVKQQQNTIDRLAGIVRDHGASTAPANPVGVNSVLVSTTFKAACDSLPAQIDLLNLTLADKDSAIAEWSDILAYEIQIRDEEINNEMEYSDSLKVDFKKQTANLKASLKLAEPKGRFMAGISILGNQNQFLSGAGVVIAYQTKGGKQYQVSPKFIKVPGAEAEVYYEGTVLFTIFK